MNHNRVTQFQQQIRQRGFTLMEVMIGMTLGIFLVTGVIQLFLSNKQTYKFQDATASIQENGRFALDILTNSIRMANFTGCQLNTASGTTFTTIPVTNVLSSNTDWWKNLNTNWSGTLVGYDGNVTFPGQATGTTAGDRVAGTDAIVALGGEGKYNLATDSTNDSSSHFTLTHLNKPNDGTLGVGGLVLVCNTTTTSLFQVTSTSGNTIDSNASLTTAYVAAESTMMDYVPTAFYIGVGSAGGTTRSLYQSRLQADGNSMVNEELVEGVENMQIFYGVGVGSSGVVTQYLDAADIVATATETVAGWSFLPSTMSVLSVRINLLLTSLDNNIITQPQTYIFPNDTGDSAINGRLQTATDRRMYQVFSTTIGIRNRIR